VFENRVLRKIFGPKRDEVTGEWRKLQNEELTDLYSSPNIIWVIISRKIKWVGHIALTGERRGVYRLLMGTPEGKRPLGRPKCIQEIILTHCGPVFFPLYLSQIINSKQSHVFF
jgi:hypothetical protein